MAITFFNKKDNIDLNEAGHHDIYDEPSEISSVTDDTVDASQQNRFTAVDENILNIFDIKGLPCRLDVDRVLQKLSNIQNELFTTINKLEKSEVVRQSAELECTRLHLEKSKIEAACKAMQADLQDNKNELFKVSEKYEELLTENNGIKKLANKQSSEIKSMEENVRELREKLERTESALTATRKLLNEIEQRKNNCETEKENVETQLSSLIQENHELTDLLEKKQIEENKLMVNHLSLQKDYDCLRQTFKNESVRFEQIQSRLQEIVCFAVSQAVGNVHAVAKEQLERMQSRLNAAENKVDVQLEKIRKLESLNYCLRPVQEMKEPVSIDHRFSQKSTNQSIPTGPDCKDFPIHHGKESDNRPSLIDDFPNLHEAGGGYNRANSFGDKPNQCSQKCAQSSESLSNYTKLFGQICKLIDSKEENKGLKAEPTCDLKKQLRELQNENQMLRKKLANQQNAKPLGELKQKGEHAKPRISFVVKTQNCNNQPSVEQNESKERLEARCFQALKEASRWRHRWLEQERLLKAERDQLAVMQLNQKADQKLRERFLYSICQLVQEASRQIDKVVDKHLTNPTRGNTTDTVPGAGKLDLIDLELSVSGGKDQEVDKQIPTPSERRRKLQPSCHGDERNAQPHRERESCSPEEYEFHLHTNCNNNVEVITEVLENSSNKTDFLKRSYSLDDSENRNSMLQSVSTTSDPFEIETPQLESPISPERCRADRREAAGETEKSIRAISVGDGRSSEHTLSISSHTSTGRTNADGNQWLEFRAAVRNELSRVLASVVAKAKQEDTLAQQCLEAIVDLQAQLVCTPAHIVEESVERHSVSSVHQRSRTSQISAASGEGKHRTARSSRHLSTAVCMANRESSSLNRNMTSNLTTVQVAMPLLSPTPPPPQRTKQTRVPTLATTMDCNTQVETAPAADPLVKSSPATSVQPSEKRTSHLRRSEPKLVQKTMWKPVGGVIRPISSRDPQQGSSAKLRASSRRINFEVTKSIRKSLEGNESSSIGLPSIANRRVACTTNSTRPATGPERERSCDGQQTQSEVSDTCILPPLTNPQYISGDLGAVFEKKSDNSSAVHTKIGNNERKGEPKSIEQERSENYENPDNLSVKKSKYRGIGFAAFARRKRPAPIGRLSSIHDCLAKESLSKPSAENRHPVKQHSCIMQDYQNPNNNSNTDISVQVESYVPDHDAQNQFCKINPQFENCCCGSSCCFIDESQYD